MRLKDLTCQDIEEIFRLYDMYCGPVSKPDSLERMKHYGPEILNRAELVLDDIASDGRMDYRLPSRWCSQSKFRLDDDGRLQSGIKVDFNPNFPTNPSTGYLDDRYKEKEIEASIARETLIEKVQAYLVAKN